MSFSLEMAKIAVWRALHSCGVILFNHDYLGFNVASKIWLIYLIKKKKIVCQNFKFFSVFVDASSPSCFKMYLGIDMAI